MKRWSLLVLKASSLTLIFLAAILLGALWHVDLAPARRSVARLTERALSQYFNGTVKLGSIDLLSSNSIDVGDISVYDAELNRVLKLESVRVRADVFDLARKILGSEPKVSLVFRHIRAEHAEVRIIPDEDGVPTLGTALSPRESDTSPSERYIRTWLPVIEVGSIFCRGSILGLPTLEVRLRRTQGSVLATPKGVAVDVERFGMVLSGLGGTDVSGIASVHVREPGPIWGYFDGYVGDTQASASVEVEGSRLGVVVDAPRISAAGARAFWQDYPFVQDATAHVEVSGRLPNLNALVEASIGEGRLHLTGPLEVADDVRLELAVRGRDLDLASLSTSLPRSRIDAEASLGVLTQGDQIVMELGGRTEPGSLGETQLPAMDFVSTYDRSGLVARVTPLEPGLPLTIGVDVTPLGVVEVDAKSGAFDLRHPRIRPLMELGGRATAEINARLRERQLDATFNARLTNLKTKDISLTRATLSGTAKGDIDHLDNLQIAAKLTGEGARYGDLEVSRLAVNLAGSVARPQLEAALSPASGGNIDVTGSLLTGETRGVERLEARVERGGASVDIAARKATLREGELVLDGVSVSDGSGELGIDLTLRDDLVSLRTRGDQLDLGVFEQVLQLPPGSLRGTLVVDADLEAGPDGQRGHLEARLTDGKFKGLPPLSARIKADLNESDVNAEASISLEQLGTVDATLEATLDRPITNRDAWRSALGKLSLYAYQVDLSYFNRYLEKDGPVRTLSGAGEARLNVNREGSEPFTTLNVDAQTQGLEVGLKDDGDPHTVDFVRGVDLQLGATVDGAAGASTATLRALDIEGALAAATLKTELDSAALLKAPAQAVRTALEHNLDALVLVPQRRLSTLPEQLRPVGIEGSVGARIKVDGTLKSPTVSANLQLEKLRGERTKLSRPIDFMGRLGYEHESGRTALNVEAVQDQNKLLWGSFNGTIDLPRMLNENSSGGRALDAVTGGGTLLVEQLPLALVQPAAKSRIDGKLQGVIAVSLERDAPDLNVELEVAEPSVQGVPLGDGRLSLRAGKESAIARANFTTERGQLSLEVKSQVDAFTLVSGAPLEQPVELMLASRRFDAVLLLPFVEDLFSEIGGDLDADLRVALWPNASRSANTVYNADFSGRATLTEGRLEPAELGLKLEDTDLVLEAHRDGAYNVVDVVRLGARARSDHKNLDAKARFYFKGLALSHGWATVGAERVPFMSGGVRLADVTGQARSSFKIHEDYIETTLELPKVRAELPRSSERSLIDLEPNPSVVVYQPLGPEKEKDTPGLPWQVKLILGNDVSVRSSTLNLRLTGSPVLTLGEELEAAGRISLVPGGRVQVAGKLFVIENGFLSFDTGDFTNPLINITSNWRAPNGVRVTAELRGTAREPSLRLFSDPALPGGESEIYALLFGGGGSTAGGSGANPALAMGAAVLTDILGATELRDVELRATEERTGGGGQSSLFDEGSVQSYVAGVQLSDEVWFEGSYKSQTGTSGEAESGVSGTLDWRFRPDWSLRTEVGSLGTGLDLLWQYRY